MTFEEWISEVPTQTPFKFAFYGDGVYENMGEGNWKPVTKCKRCTVPLRWGGKNVYKNKEILCDTCFAVAEETSPHIGLV